MASVYVPSLLVTMIASISLEINNFLKEKAEINSIDMHTSHEYF